MYTHHNALFTVSGCNASHNLNHQKSPMFLKEENIFYKIVYCTVHRLSQFSEITLEVKELGIEGLKNLRFS